MEVRIPFKLWKTSDKIVFVSQNVFTFLVGVGGFLMTILVSPLGLIFIPLAIAMTFLLNIVAFEANTIKL